VHVSGTLPETHIPLPHFSVVLPEPTFAVPE